MLETSAIQLLPAVEMHTAQARAADPASAAKEFEAILIETILRQGGLLQAFEGSEGGSQSIMGELFVPLLARQLAEQFQLGLGEMLMKEMSASAGEK